MSDESSARGCSEERPYVVGVRKEPRSSAVGLDGVELGNEVSVVFEDEEVDEWTEGWLCEDDLPIKAFQKDAIV